MSALEGHGVFRYPVRDGRLSSTSSPSTGDFVLLTLNPSLSVAHLDAEAQKEAEGLSPGTYCALIMTEVGLALSSRPTNEYYVKLVRDPWQDATHDDSRFKLPPALAAQLAASIHPHHSLHIPGDSGRRSLRPMADFPFAGCEVDLATDSLCVRVTTASRDCSQVLSLSLDELDYLEYLGREDREVRERLRKAGEIPFQFDPQPDPKLLLQRFPISPPQQAVEDEDTTSSGEDESDSDDPDDSDDSESDNDLYNMLTAFSAFLEDSATPNIPVVDVHYDLAEIKSIEDPSHFLRERWELYQIVERATQRMLRASAEGIEYVQQNPLSSI